jgi:hypothetical protein
MMNKNTKLIKNPERGKTAPFKPYVPQYQLRGITPTPPPEEMGTEASPGKKLPFGTYFLPKAQTKKSYPILKNLPYAEIGATPFNAPLPNVGNNNEVVWAGMDAVSLDEDGNPIDMEELGDQKMIDNNWEQEEFRPPLQILEEENDEGAETMTVSDTSQLNVGYDEFVLVVRGEIVSTGAFDGMQREVRALVLGGHPATAGEPVEVDEIVLLKRVPVKVGVFIDQ